MNQKKFEPGYYARDWWKEITGSGMDADSRHKGDRAAIAQLKRAADPPAALESQKSVINLARRLLKDDPKVTFNDDGSLPYWHEEQLARIGAIAGVLALVKTDKTNMKTARLLGPQGGDDESAKMSSLRFRRLLAAKRPEDIMREMRNAVKLLDGTASVYDIADSIYYWSDNTRVRWTYAYWNAGGATPEHTEQKTAEL